MENRNIKINKGRSELTDAEIQKGKNFNDVFSKYSAASKPFYKTGWFAGGIAAVLIAAVAGYAVMETNKVEEPVAKVKEMQAPPCIHPPIARVDSAVQTFRVDADKGGVLEYVAGTTITIPAHTFLDEKGSVVTGPVDIKYREFHDPIDFFLSGIPMNYDSAGTEYHFESAGMVEVLGYQNGKPVHIAPSKSLKIAMLSQQQGTKYNLYELDTAKRQWLYKGKDRVTEIIQARPKKEPAKGRGMPWPSDIPTPNAIMEEVKIIRADIKKIEATQPAEPKLVSPKANNFTLDIDAKEFPELAVYKNVQFEIGKENTHFKPEHSRVTWEEASLKENPAKKGGYLLTLTKGKESQTYSVFPVFAGKEYEKAMGQFKEKFTEYNRLLGKRKEEERIKKEQYEATMRQFEEQRKAWALAAAERLAEYEKKYAAQNTENSVVREFEVSKFGIFNCDNPMALPAGATVVAEFKDKYGADLVFDRVFLVEKGRNRLIRYYANMFKNLKFDPKSENVLWGVTKSNSIAVFRIEDFKALKVTSGTCDFNMALSEKPLKDKEEIRSFIGM